MNKIEFSLFRLVRNAIFFFGIGLLFLRYLAVPGGGLFIWLFTILMLGAGALMGWQAINDRTALRWDDHGVEISRNFSKKSLRWNEVTNINVERLRMMMWGFIPTSSTTWINFHTAGGLIGTKKHRVVANLLDLPTGGIEALYVRLLAAHAAAAQRPAMPRPMEVEPAPTSGLDHDAIIRRHLAARDAATAATNQAPFPTAAPPRPQFGRRIR